MKEKKTKIYMKLYRFLTFIILIFKVKNFLYFFFNYFLQEMCGKKCKNCISFIYDFILKILISLDFFFSIPIDIRYQNQRRFTNKVTIFFSWIAYLLILIPTFIEIKSLLLHERVVSIVTRPKVYTNSQEMSLINASNTALIQKNPNNSNSGIYIFGIGLYNVTSNSYVEIDPKYLVVKTFFNNMTKRYINEMITLEYVNCSEKLSKYEINSNITNEFSYKNLKCIDYQTIIQGEFIDKFFTFISIKVVRCSQNVKNNSQYPEFKMINCSSEEDWKNYIQDLMLVYMDVNFNLIPKNFDNPISPFVKKTNLQLVGSLCLKIDMFLTYSNFISNDNILPSFMLSNNNFDNIYRYFYIIDTFKYIYPYDDNNGEVYNLYIRSSKKLIEINRYFDNFLQIIGTLVGFWQAIYAIIGLILYRYLDFSESFEMCNKIFKLIDPNVKEKIENNPFLIEKTININSNQFINSIKNHNVEDIILYEGLKFHKYAGIEFNFVEIILRMINYKIGNTKRKLEILDKATDNYNQYKDIKNLFNFVINQKQLLKFNFNKHQTYFIFNFLNKTKFHHQNIENFKVIKNIVSFSSLSDQEDKQLGKREILKNTLNKFRNRKRGELNPIDEKLLKLLNINEKLFNYFIYKEIEINNDFRLKNSNITNKDNEFMISISAKLKK